MAYGAQGERNGLHKDDQKQHGFWCTDAEWEGLKRVALSLSYANLTAFLKDIARGALKVVKGSAKR